MSESAPRPWSAESHNWVPSSAPQSPQHSTKQPLPPRKRPSKELVLVLAWCFCSLIYGLLLCLVGPTVSVLTAQTNSTPGDLAPVLFMGGICTIIGSIPSGALMDRLPGNPFMAGTLLFQAIGYVIIPQCTTVFALACIYALVSFTFNFINTGINVMVIWTFKDPQTLALVLNTISAVFGLGGILAPQLVNVTTWMGDGALSYYIVAGLTVCVALMLVGLPSPVDTSKDSTTIQQPTDNVTTTIEGGSVSAHPHHRASSSSGSGNSSSQFAVPVALPGARGAEQSGGITTPLTGHVGLLVDQGKGPIVPKGRASEAVVVVSAVDHSWSVLVPSMITIFANVSIELGYAAWIFTYASELGGLTETGSENMTSMFWLLFVLGRGVAAILATCVRASTLLLVSMPLAIVGSILPLVWPGVGCTVASVVLVGLGAACGFPSTMSITAEYTHLSGTINGVISMVAGLSMTLMPSFVPTLAKWDPDRGFAWLMLLTLFMAVVQYVSLIQLLVAGAKLMKRRRSVRDPSTSWHQTVSITGTPHGDENGLTAPLLGRSVDE